MIDRNVSNAAKRLSFASPGATRPFQHRALPVDISPMGPEIEFGKVLAAARAGEEWAVAVLYRDLHPRLRRYLGARAGGAADDLEGEVWLAVAQRLHQFEGDELAF